MVISKSKPSKKPTSSPSSSLSYLWDAFDFHHTMFKYIPYPKLLNWDINKKQIYTLPLPSKIKLVPWYIAIFLGIWTSGFLCSLLIIFEQFFRGNLRGMMTTMITITVLLCSLISGGTAILSIYYQENICQYFHNLACIHRHHLMKPNSKRKNGPARSLHSFLLQMFINLIIFGAATSPIPFTIFPIVENLEPLGKLMELYILPNPTERSISVIFLSFFFRLVVSWVAVLEASRAVSFQILVFMTVTQIYLEILKECTQYPWLPSSLRNFVMLQMIHESAKPPGNIMIALLMGSAIQLNVMAFWVVAYCWGKVLWFIYLCALVICVGIPATVIALMPFAVNIHEMSTQILWRYKQWSRQSENCIGVTRNIKWRKLRIKALRKVNFSCGNFFKLQRSSKIMYLNVTIDFVTNALLGIPVPF